MAKNGAIRHKKTIAFLKACYQADNREQLVYNYFDKKIEHKLWIEDVGVLTGDLNYLPIEDNYADEVLNELALYKHEKSLYIGALFLCGVLENSTRKLFAPLLLIPASIELNNDGYNLHPDFSSISINPAIFRSINANNGDDYISISGIQDIIKNGALGFSEIAQIERVFANAYPEVDATDLLLYPDLITEHKIKKIKELRLVSGAGVCVLRKSSNSVSIIKELNDLAQMSEISGPLNQLLGINNGKKNPVNVSYNFTPAALNASQLKAIHNARTQSVSIIIGPPGTGKSYTIAAIAIDALMTGKSVLITSAKNQAVDVVQKKIEEDFGLVDVPIRAGGKGDYKTLLKTRIDNILSGISVEHVEPEEFNLLRKKVDHLLEKVVKTESKFLKQSEWAKKAGKNYVDSKKGFLKFLRTYLLKLNTKRKTPLWELLFSLEKMYPEKYELIKDLIRLRHKTDLYKAVNEHRKQIRQFSTAIRSRTIQTREQRFQEIDFEVLKGVFPVWLVNLNEAANVLPFKKGFFDLVIIDEASQCNLATALPLLQRAKHVVVCGDPKQLRHVSFLSAAKIDRLASIAELTKKSSDQFNYRHKSILDLGLEQIESQDALTFLNEHFRSKPDIIGFSNRHFYNGKLRLMTERPFIKHEPSVFFNKLGGERINGVNKIEAEFVISEIQRVIDQDLELGIDYKRSIGVLSPFREQVNYLDELVHSKIPIGFINKHQIGVGTAHSFQGEERDVMFISFSVDKNSHPTALRHLNQYDVFNVSITRARNEQHIVYSRRADLFPANSLMYKYLSQDFNNAIDSQLRTENKTDDFANEIIQKLKDWGFANCYINYPIMSIQFDIVVEHNSRLYGIDLIGFTGPYEDVLALEKIKIFKRAGNRVFALPYHQWLLDQSKVEVALRHFFADVNRDH